MNEHVDFDPAEPGIDISYQLPLDDGSGRVVVFRTLVAQKASAEDFNLVLDKLSDAAERQKARAVMPTYEGELEDKKAMLVTETKKLFEATVERDEQNARWQQEANENSRGKFRPTPQQKTAHVQIEAKIAGHTQNVNVLNKQIESEEKRLAIYRSRLGKEA